MISDTLFDLAMEFKKTKLWDKIYDSNLFAVKHSDGTIGYCCVMGMLGEHLALAVYPGIEGLDSYRQLGADRSNLSPFEIQEIALSQNCVMISFENKDELRPRELKEARAHFAARKISPRGKKSFPQFQRFRPRYFPWYIDDETDQRHLREGLEACLEVNAQLNDTPPEALGFSEGPPYHRAIPLLAKKGDHFTWSTIELPEQRQVEYPSPEVLDDLALAKLHKIKKPGKEWACDILMHSGPMSDEEGADDYIEEPENAPFYPYLLLIVDHKTGQVLHFHISKDRDDYTEQFTRSILEIAQSIGRPSQILVCNERTHAFFKKLSGQLGAKLQYKEHIPLLTEIEQDMYNHFNDEEIPAELEFEQLMEQITDPGIVAQMPDELVVQLHQMAQMGALPEDVAALIGQEHKRRRL